MALGTIVGIGAASAGLNLLGTALGSRAQRKAARRAAAAQRAAIAEANKIIEAQKERYQPTIEQGERAGSLIRRALGAEEDTDYSMRRSYRDYRNFIGADRALEMGGLAAANKATAQFGTARGGNAIQAILATKSRLASQHAGSYLQGLGGIQARGDQARQSITQLDLQRANNALSLGGVEANLAFQRANSQVSMYQGFANALNAGITSGVNILGHAYPDGLPTDTGGGGSNPTTTQYGDNLVRMGELQNYPQLPGGAYNPYNQRPVS